MEVVMIKLFRRPTKPLAGSVAAALTLGLVALVLTLGSTASAQSDPACSDPASAPAGPATVSAVTSSKYGKVLVVGSGDYAGCSLYLLTSDRLHTLTGSHYACSDDPNAIGAPCDTVLWPALLTKGAPVAGPGVDKKLLGTVTRTDLPGVPGAQEQVTYAGQPLYRFVFDDDPGDTQGANLFDPVTNPVGTWYLVEPTRGNPATGPALLRQETAPVGRNGTTNATVLAARMNNDFTDLFADASFPAYTLSPGGPGHGKGPHGMGCRSLCEQYWQPILTSGKPQAASGVDPHAVGSIKRPDGTEQVTYKGKPLYLFSGDAYIAGLPYNGGTASITGADAHTIWGTFNTIPPLP
jgi:predicted lipoprotein with Yx(FWY)xxD motif